MAQTKKDEVRDAILRAAFERFSEFGYSDTSIPAIAAAARISTANVYRYFPSKLKILYTLYEPWLSEQLDRIEADLEEILEPRRRLEHALLRLWRELPRAANGFANNVMQALSTSGQGDAYEPHLRRLFQRRVARWLAGALDLSARDCGVLAGVVLMAFDGFATNVHLKEGVACMPVTVRLMAGMFVASSVAGRDSDGPDK